MSPLVSVILPTCNRPEFLRSAIRTALSQTHQNIEVLVVDDASRESMQGIAEEFADRRIRYFRHQTNKGEAGARNTGLKHASGSFIAFLDDDDEWLPEKLALQIHVFNAGGPETGLVYTGYSSTSYPERRQIGVKVPTVRGHVYKEMLTTNPIGAPSTVMVRSTCIDTLGFFDETIAYGLDHDMWIRISKHYRIDFVKAPLVKYIVHSDSLTFDVDIRLKGLEDMMRKYGRDVMLKMPFYRNTYVFCALRSIENRKVMKGIGLLLKAIRVDPLSINLYYHLVLSLFGSRNYRRLRDLGRRLRRLEPETKAP